MYNCPLFRYGGFRMRNSCDRWATEHSSKLDITPYCFTCYYICLSCKLNNKSILCSDFRNDVVDPSCCSRKYPYSPQGGFFGLNPPPPPLWKFQFRLILSFNPLSPNIIIQILLTDLHCFYWLPIGRTCLNIKTVHLWGSFAQFSWLVCVIIHWYDEEKFDTHRHWGLKD